MNIPSMQQLMEAGAHFGHKVSRVHPLMKEFIYGARDGVHIIDLAKSEKLLKAAADFAFQLGKTNKILLVVGTKKQAREIVKSLAENAGLPYLTERWIPGLLTNFEEIHKNIQKLNMLAEEEKRGELTRYTKKEQLLIRRKLERFERELGGIAQLERLPDCLFVIDAAGEDVAVKEANKMGIKLIGITDTNANPALVDYPIPANDDAIKSIRLIAATIIEAYQEGRENAKKSPEKEVAPPPDAKKKRQEADEITPEVSEETQALEEKIEQEIVEESKGRIE